MRAEGADICNAPPDGQPDRKLTLSRQLRSQMIKKGKPLGRLSAGIGDLFL